MLYFPSRKHCFRVLNCGRVAPRWAGQKITGSENSFFSPLWVISGSHPLPTDPFNPDFAFSALEKVRFYSVMLFSSYKGAIAFSKQLCSYLVQ
jgi:hypothetical protein